MPPAPGRVLRGTIVGRVPLRQPRTPARLASGARRRASPRVLAPASAPLAACALPARPTATFRTAVPPTSTVLKGRARRARGFRVPRGHFSRPSPAPTLRTVAVGSRCAREVTTATARPGWHGLAPSPRTATPPGSRAPLAPDPAKQATTVQRAPSRPRNSHAQRPETRIRPGGFAPQARHGLWSPTGLSPGPRRLRQRTESSRPPAR